MQKILGQILSGTCLDSHQERLPKEFLEDVCNSFKGKRIPLHRMHDMANDTNGYIENMRLCPHESIEGEWVVRGDVTFEGDLKDFKFGGFSISFVENVKPGSIHSVYVPYPLYNDRRIFEKFIGSVETGVGKWVKKSAEDTQTILSIIQIVISVASPAWEDIYNRFISPSISRFVYFNSWIESKNNVNFEHVQCILYKDREIELRFMPPAGREKIFLSNEAIKRGIRNAIAFLESKEEDTITRIVLKYDMIERSYIVLRYECSIII